MDSKLSIRAYLMGLLAIPTLIMPILLFFNRELTFGEDYNLKFIFVGSLSFIASIYLIFATLRRAIYLKLDGDKLVVRGNFNKTQHYDLLEFDGFETTIETSRSGSFEVLYLKKDTKRLVAISEFHIRNYKEIKRKISASVTNLGEVPFSFFRW